MREAPHDCTIAIIGAGPCGLVVSRTLLESGVAPHDIVLIDDAISDLGCRVQLQPGLPPVTLRDSLTRATSSGGMGKGSESGTHVTVADERVKAPSRVWGASCLPVPRISKWRTTWETPGFAESLAIVSSRFAVQHEVDGLGRMYPPPPTDPGKLVRKHMAYAVVEGASESDEILIGHSRLAVEVSGERQCILCGGCFRGCVQGAPWSPISELADLLDSYGDMRVLADSVVAVDSEDGGVRLFLASGRSLRSDHALIAAGAESTARLLGADPLTSLECSPVVLVPLVVRAGASDSDFNRSFVYHDVVVSSVRSAESDIPNFLAQIYLPSVELGGRVLSQMPRLVLRGLLSLTPSLSRVQAPLRHIGIAMIFFPGERGSRFGASQDQVRAATRVLAECLRTSSVTPIPALARRLPRGAGAHVGALDQRSVVGSLGKGRIHVVDTSILPEVPAGPHTLTAAALARSWIRNEFLPILGMA